jgi:hypothetical protein
MTRLKQGRQLTTAPDWQAAIKRLDDAYSENTLQRIAVESRTINFT